MKRTTFAMILMALASVTVAHAQPVERHAIPCSLTPEKLVSGAAAVFGRLGCRVTEAFPELGAITAEFVGEERGFYSPTVFHLALVGDTLHVTVFRTAGISGGQTMYREVEADVANPILAELRKLTSTPIGQ